MPHRPAGCPDVVNNVKNGFWTLTDENTTALPPDDMVVIKITREIRMPTKGRRMTPTGSIEVLATVHKNDGERIVN